jgi:hypothetical protein
MAHKSNAMLTSHSLHTLTGCTQAVTGQDAITPIANLVQLLRPGYNQVRQYATRCNSNSNKESYEAPEEAVFYCHPARADRLVVGGLRCTARAAGAHGWT